MFKLFLSFLINLKHEINDIIKALSESIITFIIQQFIQFIKLLYYIRDESIKYIYLINLLYYNIILKMKM